MSKEYLYEQCIMEAGAKLKKRGVERPEEKASNMCKMWLEQAEVTEKTFADEAGSIEEKRKQFYTYRNCFLKKFMLEHVYCIYELIKRQTQTLPQRLALHRLVSHIFLSHRPLHRIEICHTGLRPSRSSCNSYSSTASHFSFLFRRRLLMICSDKFLH